MVGVPWASIEAVEIVSSLHRTVGVIPVGSAMELIGAGFNGDVDGCTPGHSLFGIETVGNNVNRLNGICWRYVGDDMRQPGIADGGPIQAGVVIGSRNAVDVSAHGTLRISGVGMQFFWRSKARHQLQQILKVPPAI